jgi:hypothetical protein
MNRRFATALILFSISLFFFVGCFGRHPNASCKERERAYRERSEKLKHDALEKLVTGTKKDEVVRFFEEHGLPVTFARGVAQGEVFLEGCAPPGCGSDRVILGLIVKVDDADTMIGEPIVGGIYTDCM